MNEHNVSLFTLILFGVSSIFLFDKIVFEIKGYNVKKNNRTANTAKNIESLQ